MQDVTGSLPQTLRQENDSPIVGQPFNYSKILDAVLIPQPVYADASLSPGARLLWGIIRRLAHKTGQCFATDARLAGELGVNERQIRRYCRQLVAGQLLRETVQPGRSTVRELLWNERFNGAEKGPVLSDVLQADKRRRLSDGNRRPPRTDSSTPTLDENVRGVRTDSSTPILMDFLRGSLEAPLPPPSPSPPLNPPPARAGGEEREKVTNQDEPVDALRALGSRSHYRPSGRTHEQAKEKPSLNAEVTAADRTPEQLAKFLRVSYVNAMGAEPGLNELNSLVRLLRARHVDHIAYSLHMWHVIKNLKKPATIGLWIKIAAEFGQGVSAADLASPD